MATYVRRSPGESVGTDVSWLVAGLAFASAVELAILRTFTRTAIHIPALDSLQKPYAVLTAAGEYAYFVAVALVVPALAALAFHLFRARRHGRHLALLGLGLFAVPASLAAFGQANQLLLDLATIASVAMLSLAFAVSTPDRRLAAIPVACFGIAFGLSGTYTTLPSLEIDAVQPAWLLDGAEYLGLAFAVSSPLLLSRETDRGAWWIGVGVAAFVLVVFLGNGSTSRFLLLWNIGLSGILPAFAYAIAAGALVATGVGFARRSMWLAAGGMLLLVTGGFGLHSTYQSALVVVALAALCCAIPKKERLVEAVALWPTAAGREDSW